jgi:hypothetical protein
VMSLRMKVSTRNAVLTDDDRIAADLFRNALTIRDDRLERGPASTVQAVA